MCPCWSRAHRGSPGALGGDSLLRINAMGCYAPPVSTAKGLHCDYDHYLAALAESHLELEFGDGVIHASPGGHSCLGGSWTATTWNASSKRLPGLEEPVDDLRFAARA